MSDESTHLRLRLPVDLKEAVRKNALQNQRSINGEIVFVLRQHQKTASEPAA